MLDHPTEDLLHARLGVSDPHHDLGLVDDALAMEGALRQVADHRLVGEGGGDAFLLTHCGHPVQAGWGNPDPVLIIDLPRRVVGRSVDGIFLGSLGLQVCQGARHAATSGVTSAALQVEGDAVLMGPAGPFGDGSEAERADPALSGGAD